MYTKRASGLAGLESSGGEFVAKKHDRVRGEGAQHTRDVASIEPEHSCTRTKKSTVDHSSAGGGASTHNRDRTLTLGVVDALYRRHERRAGTVPPLRLHLRFDYGMTTHPPGLAQTTVIGRGSRASRGRESAHSSRAGSWRSRTRCLRCRPLSTAPTTRASPRKSGQ